MKRLGVFVFYDANGIVNDYVFFLLNSIMDVVDKLVIVVNKGSEPGNTEKFRFLTPYFYVRENIGYDGGAYKDAFLKFLVNENWNNWDEIVLFNDTFYGPFFSWKYIFDKFSKEIVDFWGLSKWIGGTSKLCDCEIKEHVQGYFIVIRKNMFLSPCFLEFWNNLQYPLTYQRAIIDFEVGFSTFFSKNGFRYKTWIDLMNGTSLLSENKVVYLQYADRLISELCFPIVKRKVFSIINFTKAEKIIRYIKKEYSFDVTVIYKHLKYLDDNHKFKPFSIKEMVNFYNNHRKIYVYGYGEWGHEIERYFKYRQWNVEKFVVSERVDEEQSKMISFSDLVLEENDGLILALGSKALAEVYPVVIEKYSDTQLLSAKF